MSNYSALLSDETRINRHLIRFALEVTDFLSKKAPYAVVLYAHTFIFQNQILRNLNKKQCRSSNN
ncbi:hypothetical protein VEZ01S_20_01420 [Vibrio ezurae NBRC 102218]|uniref:Uncharacterized protein n=1 Tax=Vibrio ezurae NBRC 102218 TaxID=1219080 RepID=U3CF56_9VIBR|nr:hypothetical protein VEZ01S_20_01420 [Vibrio ezurae NBRC 102218]